LKDEKNMVLAELKEKEKMARLAIIIDAAEKEFTTKPFPKVTIRDIAKRAGISPALIYRHFPDQQSLFVEAFMQGISQVFEKIFATIDESEDGAIEKVIADFIEYFTRNDQYFQMMMNFFLGGSVDQTLFAKLTKIERIILGHFDLIFKKMNAVGDPRRHSHTLFAALTGIGGIFTEALKDVSFRVAPLTEDDAREMLREIRAVKLLDAFRGEKAVEQDILVHALVGIGNLGMAHDDIAKIDINPLIVTEGRPVAVNALVILKTSRA
jgi:AcrR family transcriptional regulator